MKRNPVLYEGAPMSASNPPAGWSSIKRPVPVTAWRRGTVRTTHPHRLLWVSPSGRLYPYYRVREVLWARPADGTTTLEEVGGCLVIRWSSAQRSGRVRLWPL